MRVTPVLLFGVSSPGVSLGWKTALMPEDTLTSNRYEVLLGEQVPRRIKLAANRRVGSWAGIA